ncbi:MULTISPECIES: FeoA family protein [unclassified Adlercreutzia]|uniref:FeoA family protein n=1 Tax=unclassified Adlercreutzia TaxID=2636013 RepID=UPI001F14EC80|nr:MULTISPECIES: FeoA family protein [unclassified Adlercreutzia]
MQNAMVAEDTAFATPATRSAHQMPLTFMHAGETAHVIKVRGKDEIHHHLENLGFVAGAPVRVVTEQAGNLIVEIKGCQVALDKSAASKIIAA